MTYNVFSGTLNTTHSLTHSLILSSLTTGRQREDTLLPLHQLQYRGLAQQLSHSSCQGLSFRLLNQQSKGTSAERCCSGHVAQ